MDLRIWLDAWQMQCCGDPFAVGDKVSWSLREADSDWLETVLGAAWASGVDAAEEHHGGAGADAQVAVGTVVSIDAVYCRYAPLPDGPERVLHAVPGSGAVSSIDTADGWTPDRGDLRFAGYVVRLRQADGR